MAEKVVVAGGNRDVRVPRWDPQRLGQAIEGVFSRECDRRAVLKADTQRARLRSRLERATGAAFVIVHARAEIERADCPIPAELGVPGDGAKVLLEIRASDEAHLGVEIRLHRVIFPVNCQLLIIPGALKPPRLAQTGLAGRAAPEQIPVKVQLAEKLKMRIGAGLTSSYRTRTSVRSCDGFPGNGSRWVKSVAGLAWFHSGSSR